MSNNTTLNAGSGGDVLRDIDKAGVKTPVVTIDLGGAGAESLIAGAMPVTGTFWQATQPVSIASAVPVTGTFWQATQPVSIAGTVAVASVGGSVEITNDVGNPIPVSGTVGVSGSVAVTGTFWQATQPVSGTVSANPAAATSGGATPYHLISAASTNATSVKASAGVVYAISAFNTNASARFLKLYDGATAPTVGTTPVVLTLLIPPSNGGFTLPVPVGIQFSSGIALAVTGGIADSDNTAIGAADVVVDLIYK